MGNLQRNKDGSMSFADLITSMTTAAAKGDGGGVADCFTDDGVYHDVFYGAFAGRTALIDMIENHFHRDGGDFRWDIYDPVSDGQTGYARYVFSYQSKLPEAEGRRALFEGVAVVKLKDGKIAEYREVANAMTGLQMMGFPPERLAKVIAKEGRELAARDESAGHL